MNFYILYRCTSGRFYQPLLNMTLLFTEHFFNYNFPCPGCKRQTDVVYIVGHCYDYTLHSYMRNAGSAKRLCNDCVQRRYRRLYIDTECIVQYGDQHYNLIIYGEINTRHYINARIRFRIRNIPAILDQLPNRKL